MGAAAAMMASSRWVSSSGVIGHTEQSQGQCEELSSMFSLAQCAAARKQQLNTSGDAESHSSSSSTSSSSSSSGSLEEFEKTLTRSKQRTATERQELLRNARRRKAGWVV